MKKIIFWGLGLTILAIIVIMGLSALGAFANWGWRLFAAPIEGKVQQVEITNTGAFRIQAYNRFYEINEDIRAIDSKIAAYAGSTDIRDQTTCKGLAARKADLVAEYNSKAKAIKTTGQWQAPDLPDLLIYDQARDCNR